MTFAPESVTSGVRDLPRYLPPDEAMRLVSGLSWDNGSRRLDAAVRFATGLEAGSGRVAVMGFCWGGDQAFRYARVRPDLDAAVIFYGAAPDTVAAAGIRLPSWASSVDPTRG